jgi:NADPH:quinone reductase-like Zn-dependent oxidoreductase
MKAIRFHEYGDIDVLRYEEAPTPRPGPAEVLVAVAATAFNPVDRWFRAGAMDEILPVRLPHTLGLDMAGTVVDHGPGVEDPAIGTAVIAFLPMTGPGAGAEFVNAPAELLVRASATTALIDAAALPVPALTAWQACSSTATSSPGSAYSSTEQAAASADSSSNSQNGRAP